MSNENKRYLLLDGIRGFAIANMVLFHFLYDLYIIYELNPHWYNHPLVQIWQQAICWTFILISGMAWSFGKGIKKRILRGIELNFFGLVISLITWLVIPDEAIWFGILNFIGCAVIIMIPLHPYLQKVPALLGTISSFILFLLLKNLSMGYIGLEGMPLFKIPDSLRNVPLLIPLGFPNDSFSSSDYFPILSWIFLFFTGYFLCRLLTKQAYFQKYGRLSIPFLSKTGQKSIWVYLLHQPVCLIICQFLFGQI